MAVILREVSQDFLNFTIVMPGTSANALDSIFPILFVGSVIADVCHPLKVQ